MKILSSLTKDQKNLIVGTIILFFMFVGVSYIVISFVLMSWSMSSWPIGVLMFYRFMLVIVFAILGFSLYYNYNRVGQGK